MSNYTLSEARAAIAHVQEYATSDAVMAAFREDEEKPGVQALAGAVGTLYGMVGELTAVISDLVEGGFAPEKEDE